MNSNLLDATPHQVHISAPEPTGAPPPNTKTVEGTSGPPPVKYAVERGAIFGSRSALTCGFTVRTRTRAST